VAATCSHTEALVGSQQSQDLHLWGLPMGTCLQHYTFFVAPWGQERTCVVPTPPPCASPSQLLSPALYSLL
jgi:hypothetical protein